MQGMWTNEVKSPLIFFLLIIIFPYVLVSVIPRKSANEACLGIEWELQNASRCLANPNVWEEWSRIGQLYESDDSNTLGTIGCPIFISKIKGYSFIAEENQALLNYFVETYKNHEDISIPDSFKKATGRDFCEVAEQRGWTQEYLARKNEKNL